MNSRAIKFSLELWLTCLTLFLCSPLDLYAQVEMAEHVPGSVQTSVELEARTWTRGKPAFVVMKVKNTSHERVKVVGKYVLTLTKVGDRTHYTSLVDIVSGTSLKEPTVSRKLDESAAAWEAMERTVHLEPGEVKAVKFDLSNLFWYEFINSDWSSREMEAVPQGRYHLTFNISLRERRDSKGTVTSTGIGSERVEIVVE